MSKKRRRKLTRRGALGLMAVGGSFFVLRSGGFGQTEGQRGATVIVDEDDEAVLRVFPGESSIGVQNAFTRKVTVTIETSDPDIDVESDGGGSLDVTNGVTTTLAPPDSGNGIEGESLDLVFSSSAGDETGVAFDVTAEVDSRFESLSLSRTIDVQSTGDIEDDPDPQTDTDPAPVSVLAEPAGTGDTSTHTWPVLNVESTDIGFTVEEIELDYTGVGTDALANTQPRTTAVSVIDDSGNPEGVRIDRGGSSFGNETVTLGLQNSFDVSGTEDIVVITENVQNPGSTDVYEPTITFRGSSSSVAFGGELAVGSVSLDLQASKGTIGEGESNDITATVTDASSTGLENVFVSFAIDDSAGNWGSLTPATAETDTAGEATTTFNADNDPVDENKSVTIRARAALQDATATFTLENTNTN